MNSGAQRLQQLLVLLFAGLVLANAFAAGLRTVADSDTGWHVATGRYVWQHRTIPSSDVLSYGSAGMPWIYPPFGGVLLYLAYRVGGYAALSWLSALACVGVIAYLVRKRNMPSLVLAMLAIPAIAYRTAPRADLFTTVLFAILLGELWAYSPAANSSVMACASGHAAVGKPASRFIAGLGVHWSLRCFRSRDLIFAERRRPALHRLRAAWPWLVAGVAATLINPWGPRIYPAALNLGGSVRTGRRFTEQRELHPGVCRDSHHVADVLPTFRRAASGERQLVAAADCCSAGPTCGVAQSNWERQWWSSQRTYAALAHARYLGMFAIVMVTLGATLLEGVVTTDEVDIESHAPQRPLVQPASAVAGALHGRPVRDCLRPHCGLRFQPVVCLLSRGFAVRRRRVVLVSGTSGAIHRAGEASGKCLRDVCRGRICRFAIGPWIPRLHRWPRGPFESGAVSGRAEAGGERT